MHFKKIIGEKVYLSPRSIEDAEKYAEWLNNIDISKYVGQHTNIISLESEREYLEKHESDTINFAIVDMKSNMLIGSIGLKDINYINRTAELGIFIGEEDHLSLGYGSEAIRLMLDFGFNHLNLNNIFLKSFSFNPRALRAYEKCGFKKFGIWKESTYFGGKYYDIVFMNILKKDFNKKIEKL